jgi:hypothetical protein
MKKLFAVSAAALMALSVTATTASAKKMKRGYHSHHTYDYGPRGYYRGPGYNSYGMMRRSSPFSGNAAMSGNNGNSAYGSNSLGHIQGGNIGGGK